MNEKVVVEKIRKFLQKHSNFKEECEALYLSAEIRKIIESSEQNKEDYKALYFYCCWALHIHLTRGSAKYISDKFNKDMDVKCLAELKEGMKLHYDFFKLEDLKSELKQFFINHDNLPQNILNENKKWKLFKEFFLKIIAECSVKLLGNFKSLNVEIKNGKFIYRFVLNKYFKNDKDKDKNVIKIKTS